MIYIQSNIERTMANHFDCSCALYGAIETVQDYRLTTFEEVTSGKFDSLIKHNLFVGSVEFMREVFKRVGLFDVRLPMNSNRSSQIITLAQAHNYVAQGRKIFIKPIEIKLFTGLVLDGFQYGCLSGIPEDTKVLSYEPFTESIESEWRIYVQNNQIIDSRNYGGNFEIIPQYDYVRSVIEENKKKAFPCAYTIDIAIFLSNENVVVEFNDMWAIGNYGMQNDWYLRALRDRYFEIMRSCKIKSET